MADKIFGEGIYYDLPVKAPEFVKGKITIEVDKFVEFIKKHRNGDFVRLDVKQSKAGKLYLELNTWKPGKPQGLDVKVYEVERNQTRLNEGGLKYPTEEINPNDIPF